MRFYRQHAWSLLFGVLQLFFSAPGQTFLMSLLMGSIFSSLHMSLGWIAGSYSLATILGALLLNPAGRLIDRFSPQLVMVANAVVMAIGCLCIASAHGFWLLFIGFFLTRFIGQGVFGMSASVLLSHAFYRNRGKAMGAMSLGFPLSELIYPGILVFVLSWVGWRWTYALLGLSTLVLMLPIQWAVLLRANLGKGHFFPGEMEYESEQLPGFSETLRVADIPSYSLKTVMRDPKFYALVLAAALPTLGVTGLFFFQSILFSIHHWPIMCAAMGLAVYAVTKAIFSVCVGSVIDRYGSVRPFICANILLAAGILLAALGGGVVVMYLYFALVGGALGMSAPIVNVIWPNLYGNRHIGSIQGFVATFRNGLTALAPLPLAIAIDRGISFPLLLEIASVVTFFLAFVPIGVALVAPQIDGPSRLRGVNANG